MDKMIYTYDGHGINYKGERIAKVCINRDTERERYDSLSKLFQYAPNMKKELLALDRFLGIVADDIPELKKHPKWHERRHYLSLMLLRLDGTPNFDE